jgi:hypothetical protein
MDTSQSAQISRRTFIAAVRRNIVCAGVLGVSALLTLVAGVNAQDADSFPFVRFIPNGTLCLPLIRPIGSRRPSDVFVMEPTDAGYFRHRTVGWRLHTPWFGRVLGQR